MTKQRATKIGDIFSIQISEKEKRFFQFVALDLLQLNSDVIRCFSKTYSLETNPHMETIVTGDILFYAHCVTKLGLKMNMWTKVGKSQEVGT